MSKKNRNKNNRNGHKKNAVKILKRTNKLCPDCGESNLLITERSELREGVKYSDKYYECLICEYIEIIKDKHNKKRPEIIEEE